MLSDESREVFSVNWGRGRLRYRELGDAVRIWFVGEDDSVPLEVCYEQIYAYVDHDTASVWLTFYQPGDALVFMVEPPEHMEIVTVPHALREFLSREHERTGRRTGGEAPR